MSHATGKVVKAFGNLLHVKYEGHVRQGEIAFINLPGVSLKGEIIEIAGDEAKVQVFEDTREVKLNTEVEFTTDLLEAELGPGLLSSIVDGLQNPLERVANETGLFLERGAYFPSLDREKRWDFHPSVSVGDEVERGDFLGSTMEGRFHHQIMFPFKLNGKYLITHIESQGTFTITDKVAKAKHIETGEEIDICMMQKWPVKRPLIVGRKVRAKKMLDTGMRILDTQFPIVKGGTFCSPGPFGAGKTVLQHHLSKFASVDIVVVTACGERAGEVVEVLKTFPHLIDPHTSEPLITRTVMICNTSSMPVAAREASVYMGVTIGEYYRQMGLDVLLLADSTSRWAQAMREMSGRLEEIPGEEAFPAYLGSRIAAFYERSGVITLKKGEGSLTIGGTVSPAGGNFEEPVTQATLSSVGAFHGLSRARSDARKYPAIDPLISWSKYLPSVCRELEEKIPTWGKIIREAQILIQEGDEIGKRMEVVGEEGISIEDLNTFLKSELYEFSYLQQNAFDKEDEYCPLDRQMELIQLISTIFSTDFSFSSHDEARSFFHHLQNSIKNLNFMPFHSENYKKHLAEAYERIQHTTAL